MGYSHPAAMEVRCERAAVRLRSQTLGRAVAPSARGLGFREPSFIRFVVGGRVNTPQTFAAVFVERRRAMFRHACGGECTLMLDRLVVRFCQHIDIRADTLFAGAGTRQVGEKVIRSWSRRTGLQANALHASQEPSEKLALQYKEAASWL
jgi:hypothetical protein